MWQLTSMTETECWERVGSRGMARIGFDRGRGPRIHPVDYTVIEDAVYLRTAPGTELADFISMFGDGSLVSFEIDQLSAQEGERWSVLMAAHVEVVPEDEARAVRPRQDPVPSPSDARPLLVRLRPVELTGRRLVDEPAPGRASAPDPHRGPAEEPGAGSRRLPDYWLG